MTGSVFARLGVLWAKLRERMPETGLRERFAGAFERPKGPLMVITKRPRTKLAVTMASVTVKHYIDAGQVARLSDALSRYAKGFDEVVFITPDRMTLTDEFAAENVTHLRVLPFVYGPWIFRTAISTVLRFRSFHNVTAVLALDEAGAVPGWIVAKASGSDLVLSAGAPWAPPKPKKPFDGIKAWPVRQAVKRISDVTLWEGETGRGRAESAERHALPAFVDANLYCPLITTDPSQPRMVGAFVSASDTASAIGLIGAAETLKHDGHNLMFRVFVVSGSDGEAKAAALQGDVAERSAPIEFSALPRVEMLPDVISRLRICLSFGADETLPFTLRAMSSGIPCIVVGLEDDESVARWGWRDFVLKSGGSNEQIAYSIEALLREPTLRLRMAREGRRVVTDQHSLDAIAAHEVAILKKTPIEKPSESAGDDFNADEEAEKLAAMLEAIGVARSDDEDKIEVVA